MKAVQYFTYGSPEKLQLNDIPVPQPQKGEVRIRLKAAAVNSWDWDRLTGKPWLYRVASGWFRPHPSILGCDVAGHIDAVGPECSRFKVGDAVFGDISTVFGGFAEYVCVPENAVHPLAVGIDMRTAAALPHTAELAYQSLFVAAKVRPGDELLLIGGGGGTGSFAVQFAKNAGAVVTVVDGASKKEAVLSWGADYYMNFREENIWKSGKQFDLIVDMVAQQSPRRYARILKNGGQLVVVGGKPGSLLQVVLWAPFYAKYHNKQLGLLMHQPNQNLEVIQQWYTEGRFRAIIAKTYPLEQVPQALKELNQAELVGKLVIKIA